MYLHLGGEAVVSNKDIIAVFDMDNTTVSKSSRRFLARAQELGEVVNVSDDLPKTYVLAKSKGGVQVYISSISSSTLLKRSRN